jgi:hypothetical protein
VQSRTEDATDGKVYAVQQKLTYTMLIDSRKYIQGKHTIIVLRSMRLHSTCLTLLQPQRHLESLLLKENTKGDTDVAKRGAKEASRQQVLTNKPVLSDNTPANWKSMAEIIKAKQAAVGKLMLPAKKHPRTALNELEANPLPKGDTGQKKPTKTPANTKQKGAPRKTATKRKQQEPTSILHNLVHTNNTRQVETTIQLCGCRHGDLSALKSFTKTEAIYYTQPGKYLEVMKCLDCKRTVMEMKPAARGQRPAVVFYCDQGIKGHDAPDDDAMKAELTCDLVLCPQCEAIRRIAFEKETAGGRSRRRKQS